MALSRAQFATTFDRSRAAACSYLGYGYYGFRYAG